MTYKADGRQTVRKAYADEDAIALTPEEQRQEDYRNAIEKEKQNFFGAVSSAKPYLDYVALLTINAAIIGMFFVVIGRAFSLQTFSDRGMFGAIVLFLLWASLWTPLNRTTEAIALIGYFRVVRRLGMTYPYRRKRSATGAWLAGAFLTVVTLGVQTGTGFVGHEFARRTVEAVGSAETETPKIKEKAASQLTTGSILQRCAESVPPPNGP